LKEFHSSPIGGHSGYLRTYKRLSENIYWEGMKRDVQDFVARCEICQKNKSQTLSPAELLQPLPIPHHMWDDVSMDFITGLPKSHMFDTILVVVDRLTKYAHFIPLSHPFNAKDVVVVFIKEVVKLHGFPKSIVSDRDRVFISQFWKELFKLAGTTLRYSSSYHPETDGQTEVVNRSLETYLRCMAGENPKEWSHWLSWAEYWFNTSFNRSAGMTPLKALYGRDPSSIFHMDDTTSAVQEVNEQVRIRNLILTELKEHLLQAQQRIKNQADRHRRELTFEIAEMVYLKLQPYKLRSLAKKINEKLSPRFYGPYKILEKIGPVAYWLELPVGARIHSVFHVSQLRKCLLPTTPAQNLPPFLTQELELQVEPEAVRQIRKLINGKLEVLIKWKNLSEFENTWEEYAIIDQQFPDFHLEDKVILIGKGNDVPQVIKTYSRRPK